MKLSTFRRALSFAAVVVTVPAALMGCPKKAPPPVEDAGAPPPPASTPEVTELAPLTEEAGVDAEAGAPKKWTGPGMNPNQLKIKACCNGMRTQAKAMGNSPEAAQVISIAAMCDQLAAQVGPAGNAPEFNQIRQMLKSVTLPAACQF